MKWKISTLILVAVVLNQTGLAALPKYPGKIEDFKKEDYKNNKTLSEALKKKTKKVQKCFQKGKGDTAGVEKVDKDKNADRGTVNNETTKTVLNCGEGYDQIETKLLKSNNFGVDRYLVQQWQADQTGKSERLRTVNSTQARNMQKGNEDRKARGIIEHQTVVKQKQRQDIERRQWADLNTTLSSQKHNVTKLVKKPEETSPETAGA